MRVEHFPTLQGGTLRWHGSRATDGRRTSAQRVPRGRAGAQGLTELRLLRARSASASSGIRRDLRELLRGAQGGGQDDRRLRRRGQGQHAAQLRRHRRRPGRLRRRPERAQAGPAHARRAPPDPRTRARCSRSGPTTCCCWPGTTRTRSCASRRSTSPRRPLHRARPVPADRMSTVDTEPTSPARVERLPELRRPSWSSSTSSAACRSTAAGWCDTREEALTLPARRPAARRSAGRAASSPTRPSTLALQDYGVAYEETQGFSPTLPRVRARPRARAGSSATTCAARRCSRSAAGKGEFLVAMCELGGNTASGSIPASSRSALDSAAAERIRVHQGLYDEQLRAPRRATPSSAGTRSSTSRRSGEFLADIRRATRRAAATPSCSSSCRTSCACCARSRSGTSTTSTARTSAPARWRGCSGASGFEILELELDYDDQYILIEAGRRTAGSPAPHPLEEEPGERGRGRSTLRARRFAATAARWRTELGAARAPTAAAP